MRCEIEDKKEIEEGFKIIIADTSKKDGRMRQVLYNPLDHVARYSCKMFECEGIPCRHILCILKAKLDELPSYYILNRWNKMARSKPIFDVDGNVLEGCSQTNHEDKLISNNWMEFMTCMEVAGRDREMLILAFKGIQNVAKQLIALKGSTSESRVQELESFIGSSARNKLRSFLLDNLIPKVAVNELKEEKKRQWKNISGRDFVKVVGNKHFMIAGIVLQKLPLSYVMCGYQDSLCAHGVRIYPN